VDTNGSYSTSSACLILFGAGFALKALWRIAVPVLIVWALGFLIRPTASGGKRGRW
jgi:energy-coupling factor transporter transmembrane protein EcfT